MRQASTSCLRESPQRSSSRRGLWLAGGQRPFSGAFVALLLVTLLACQGSTTPPAPVDIAEGDSCARCKKPILEKQFAAQFVTRDGFARKFDDIGCMLEHVQKMDKETIAAYFSMDYDKKVWLKAEEAVYVRSQRFKTPNDGGILAFSNRARAESLTAQYQGELLTFDRLTP